ncbi:MAG TPA: N-acetylmuramoyl-L-alanine amidase [Gemmatimonadales bacterium]|jgi:N-acetylmuramoyl-L-alanine amidase|nr:N-acetylmuramoyl-L-alanine amidase [Gemmatimonadales bacterium]
MIGGVLLALGLAATAPASITLATPSGELVLPVRSDDRGAPVLYASPVVLALRGTIKVSGAWADVTLSGQPLRLLIGAPFYVRNSHVQPMAGRVVLLRDTLYVPLAFVAEELPRLFSERFRWDAANARLVETGWKPQPDAAGDGTVVMNAVPGARYTGPRLANGLRPGHLITVDAGHGGDDPGNPGLFFPGGLKEKDVTLQVALLLRDELRNEGIQVRMTRTTDVRPNLFKRAPMCGSDCDLFVSLHVDALDPKRAPNYRNVSGFSTLIIGEENTEDASRVARMENEAVRYESAADQAAAGGLAFMLRDLQMNEYLRESARAGALIQEELGQVHSGVNRGVIQYNNLAVLNTARRPAVLVEMGYSTNRSDAALLTSPASQRRLAHAIAEALVQYLREYERRTGDTAPGDSTP